MAERNDGGLWCHEVLEQLDAYVAGTVEPGALTALATHVQACDNCARFGGAYARVVASLRGLPGDELGEARVARLLRRLDSVLE